MNNTESGGAPTVRVRHFSPDPNDPGKGLVAGRVQTIAAHCLPQWQAKGFAEVDKDGNLVDKIPTAGKAAGAATASTGGSSS